MATPDHSPGAQQPTGSDWQERASAFDRLPHQAQIRETARRLREAAQEARDLTTRIETLSLQTEQLADGPIRPTPENLHERIVRLATALGYRVGELDTWGLSDSRIEELGGRAYHLVAIEGGEPGMVPDERDENGAPRYWTLEQLDEWLTGRVPPEVAEPHADDGGPLMAEEPIASGARICERCGRPLPP